MKLHESLLWEVVLLTWIAPAMAQGVSGEGPEPNGLAGNPTGITVGAQADGLIGAATDDDAYTVKLDQVTRLIAWTGPGRTKPMRDTILELCSANGQVLQVADDTPGRGAFSAIDRVLMPGIWHLVVRGANGDKGNYSLEVRADAVPPWLQEGAEPNGDPAGGSRPTPIAVDMFVEGTIGKVGDSDWFELSLSVPQLLRFWTGPGYGAPLHDPLLRLWHQPGGGGAAVVIATDDNGGGGLQAQVLCKMQGGRYFVEVIDSGLGTGTYRLKVDSVAMVEIDHAGCKGSAGRPELDVRRNAAGEAMELPILGSTFVLDGTNVPAGAPVMRVVGLPEPLFAMALDPSRSCVATVAPILADFAIASPAGNHAVALPLPQDLRLRGVMIATQAIVLDPAANPAGLAVSNRLLAHIGSTW
ncbi:MAG: hypothetical protein IPK26_22540 [Planctomycetes bacterium]|nr:hypothetical protein [Planctomycetota bacterium]